MAHSRLASEQVSSRTAPDDGAASQRGELDSPTLAARPESVFRTALVNRLRASRSYPLVTVLAPAGYGKTTLLAQWEGRDDRPFAWVSIEEEDASPVEEGASAVGVCLRIAAAIGRVESADTTALDPNAYARKSVSSAIRGLTRTVGSFASPCVVVIDDVHLLRSRECGKVLAAVTQRLPDGSTLVLSGRSLPRMPIARLRVAGQLLEVGVDDLALSVGEVNELQSRLGLDLFEPELAELTRRTEGWVTGVYLAALGLTELGASPASAASSADSPDRALVEYFEFELLAQLSRKDLRFLTRTSILDSMTGPLCDALLEAKESIRRLESLERSNAFVFPLDRCGRAYRYHHEFRQVLQAELERREPTIVPTLHRRAAKWCAANGASEDAIFHANASGDSRLLARFVEPRILASWSEGHNTTVEAWLGWFDDPVFLEKYAAVAVLGSWIHALRGRAADAERWLEIATGAAVDTPPPDGSASLETWIDVLRAAACRDGLNAMRSDSERALRDLGPASRWRAAALFLRGAADLLLGEKDRAEANMAHAGEVAESLGETPFRVAALAERSLLMADRDDEPGAESLAVEARTLMDEHRLEGYVTSAIALAVSARCAVRSGEIDRARADLEKALALRPLLTYALPWLSVHACVELARVELTRVDVSSARAWLAHAREIERRSSELGVFSDALKKLDGEISRAAKGRREASTALTAAELRLLPLLATHESFREIGERLCVSRNTVKTQAISIYRKLGVTSRSASVARAAELGLLDGSVA